ncbi:hypothetical protein Pelo_9343 [Pelomyxa schiedti]|nr:hypothetical protein Pelo_9343 [Pelomyxa schiedti]
MKVACFFLAALVLCASAEDVWSVLSKDIMTICMDVHFWSPQEGLVSGMQNMIGALVLRTVDAGANWTVMTKIAGLEMFMCLAFGDYYTGVTAGLGWDLVEMSSMYTHDAGYTWTETNDNNFIASYQDCEPVPNNDDMFVMAGFWDHVVLPHEYGYGAAISTNGGVDFVHYDWGIDTEARYISFASTYVGWISGGMWPETPEDSKYHLRPEMHHGITKDADGNFHQEFVNTGKLGAGYTGILAKTTDGGKTWVMQYNDTTSTRYFNGIHAASEKDVWVVGEGDDGAWITHTGDGGLTWEDQLFVDGGSMMTVKCFDNLECWVGGKAAGHGMDGGLWHTTDGGLSWHLTEMQGYYISYIDLLDRDHIYASAFDTVGVSALLEYLPE